MDTNCCRGLLSRRHSSMRADLLVELCMASHENMSLTALRLSMLVHLSFPTSHRSRIEKYYLGVIKGAERHSINLPAEDIPIYSISFYSHSCAEVRSSPNTYLERPSSAPTKCSHRSLPALPSPAASSPSAAPPTCPAQPSRRPSKPASIPDRRRRRSTTSPPTPPSDRRHPGGSQPTRARAATSSRGSRRWRRWMPCCGGSSATGSWVAGRLSKRRRRTRGCVDAAEPGLQFALQGVSSRRRACDGRGLCSSY